MDKLLIQTFVMGIIWALLMVWIVPELWKDVKYLFEMTKRPAAGTADRQESNKYSISNYKQISNKQDLGKWY